MEDVQGNKMEGYLWYSDQTAPTVYDGKEVSLELNDGENPFVIEGQLYDTEKRISYSIKYVDGRYLKKDYNIDSIKEAGCEVTDRCYQSNQMGGRKLQFKEVWRPSEGDSLCEGMKVLQPAEIVFVGFKKEEERK